MFDVLDFFNEADDETKEEKKEDEKKEDKKEDEKKEDKKDEEEYNDLMDDDIDSSSDDIDSDVDDTSSDDDYNDLVDDDLSDDFTKDDDPVADDSTSDGGDYNTLIVVKGEDDGGLGGVFEKVAKIGYVYTVISNNMKHIHLNACGKKFEEIHRTAENYYHHFNYFADSMFELASESPLIKLDNPTRAKEHAEGTGTRQAAIRIKNEIINIIREEKKPITLDFDGVDVMSSSFADELLAKLFIDLGLFQFNLLVKLINIDESLQMLLHKSVLQRIVEFMNEGDEEYGVM